jgi:hypothetical protein
MLSRNEQRCQALEALHQLFVRSDHRPHALNVLGASRLISRQFGNHNSMTFCTGGAVNDEEKGAHGTPFIIS